MTASTGMISQSQARAFAKALEHTKARVAHIKENTERVLDATFQVVETGVTAGALGLVNGRFGGPTGEIRVLGVPMDMLLAGLVGGAVVAGGFGKYSQHGVNVFAGAAASTLSRWGHQVGVQWAQAAANAQQQGGNVLPPAAQHAAFNGAAVNQDFGAGFPVATHA